jgi:hypothetical protein
MHETAHQLPSERFTPAGQGVLSVPARLASTEVVEIRGARRRAERPSTSLARCAGYDLADFLRCLEWLEAAVFWLNRGCAGPQMTQAAAGDLRGIANLMLRMKDEDYSADIVLCFEH